MYEVPGLGTPKQLRARRQRCAIIRSFMRTTLSLIVCIGSLTGIIEGRAVAKLVRTYRQFIGRILNILLRACLGKTCSAFSKEPIELTRQTKDGNTNQQSMQRHSMSNLRTTVGTETKALTLWLLISASFTGAR